MCALSFIGAEVLLHQRWVICESEIFFSSHVYTLVSNVHLQK
jgi:hypothetical protein